MNTDRQPEPAAGNARFPTDTTGLAECAAPTVVELRDGDSYDLRIAPVVKQIGDNRVTTFLHSSEQDCGSAPFDHPAMNFGELQIRIHFGVDTDKIFFATQEIEEGTKIWVHQKVQFSV